MIKEPNAIVSQRVEVSPGLIKLRIIPDGWELPDFKPGQYSVLGVPGSASRHPLADPEENPPDAEKLIMRAYSVASSSVAKEFIEFYIGLVHSGSLTPRLLNLKPGDKIFMGPKFKGMFTLSEVPNEYNLVLAATGTGIAPYMSMIRSELAGGERNKFAVIHGANHSIDLGYNDELLTLAEANENFTYIPILSHAHEEISPWKGQEGFVQDLWTNGTIEKSWGFKPSPDNTHVFLCGNPLMIDAMLELLEKDNFIKHSRKEAGQIHTEKYFVKL